MIHDIQMVFVVVAWIVIGDLNEMQNADTRYSMIVRKTTETTTQFLKRCKSMDELEKTSRLVTPKCQHTSNINQRPQIRFVNLLWFF